MRIGIDAGGTFTDFLVVHDDGHLESFKIRSSPADPASVILEGIRRAAGPKRIDVVHGSTVATNALLERKGARTALVATRGFEDVIRIGRQNRAELYNLNPSPPHGLVWRTFGVDERTLYDGTILKPVTEVPKLPPVESVAICFLHSYQNAANEQAALKALAGDYYLCASHEVSPEFREYERTSTTVLNAYVGPLMDRYLAALEAGTKARLSIMQSNGGLIRASEARRLAVRTLLSGPAGGVVGASGVARLSGFENILGFDMGGTSTDVSLCEGRPHQTMEASIDGFPIRVPILDIHTVGAGGGSIARVDEGGLLRVGPESAGADPGPACYGKGELPTVTDAHVVLGRITPDQFLGGGMQINTGRAEAAVACIARALRLTVQDAARGILRVANANMERAIRVVSVERGHDPRRFALLAFGGCGGLHACELAEQLSMRTVLVPAYAGVLSALGMLLADRVRDYSAGLVGRSDNDAVFRKLERQAHQDLKGATLERLYDMRYSGQSYELTVTDVAGFHGEHERVYGYADRDRPVEYVAARVRAVVAVEPLPLKAPWRLEPDGPGRFRRVPGKQRARTYKGPALIADYGATTLVPTGWTFRLDRIGTLIIER